MRKSALSTFTAVSLATAALCASAQTAPPGRVASGTFGELSWVASSVLTGANGTGGSGNTAGNSAYFPNFPADLGVVYLVMDNATACSGTLLSDRRSILTAAHCVSTGAGSTNPQVTNVYFQPAAGLAPGTRIQTNLVPAAGVETRPVTNYFVNSAYTGQVFDQNDVAVLRMATEAPAWTTSYGLYTTPLTSGTNFNVQGYGLMGDGTGTSGFAARLRSGDNRYDFRFGDPIFNGNWAAVLGVPGSQIAHSWISDFDSGLAANDASCLVAQADDVAGAAGSVFCNTGLGAREVGVAPGDSGGPNFINGLISGVNSFGLTFGSNFGDNAPAGCSGQPCLNSSFGEFSGYVPVYIHTQFIQAAMVPEPGTYALMGLGLAAVAAAARRRRAI